MSKISILLAIYNDERFIKKTIESVLSQTFQEFELLVGFNGTTDNSIDIVKSFQDDRIKIYDFKDDKGKAKTLNKLIELSQSDWIAIQDGDDLWLPKKLEMQMEQINDFDIIGTKCQYIDDEDNFIGMPDLEINDEQIKTKSLNGVNQIINTSAIFKKSKAISVNKWDEDLDGIEDFDFWLKLIKLNCKFININKILVCHRLHKKSNFNTKTYDVAGLIQKYQ